MTTAHDGSARHDINRRGAQVGDLVPEGARVLVLGPENGDVSTALHARGCDVTSVDLSEIGPGRIGDQFPPASFDAVVFDHDLPLFGRGAAPLAQARDLVTVRGTVVLTAPNAAFGGRLLPLLGATVRPLDRQPSSGSHGWCLTESMIRALVEDSGLELTHLRGVVKDPRSVLSREPCESGLPPGLVEWVRVRPDAFVEEFIAAASPQGSGRGDSLDIAVEHAVSIDSVKVDEAAPHTWVDPQVSAHQQLTLRDHVIGLEAQLAAAEAREASARAKVRVAQKKANRLAAELEELGARPRGRWAALFGRGRRAR